MSATDNQRILESLRDLVFRVQSTCSEAEMHARGVEVPDFWEVRAKSLALNARTAWQRLQDLLPDLLRALGEDNAQEPSEESRRLAWLELALSGAWHAKAALQQLPQDGPDPKLHRHLILRTSDLRTELELLLEAEGRPGREGGS